MDMKLLAAKQKRALYWADFTSRQVKDESLKRTIVAKVHAYQAKLSECWDRQQLSESDVKAIEDLERELEQLNEEARLRA